MNSEHIVDTEFKYAWAAGFIDGDGRVSIEKATPSKNGRQNFVVEVAATQGVIEPLLELDKLFGGAIYVIRNQFGEYWQWRVRGDNAASMLNNLLPYLVVKKRQAELCIRFKETIIEKRSGNGAWYGRVSDQVLNERTLLYTECTTLNNRRLCRERLSERASGLWKPNGATVRSHANTKHESTAEMTVPLS